MKKRLCLVLLVALLCQVAQGIQQQQVIPQTKELDRFHESVLGVTFESDSSKLVVKRNWEGLAGELAGLKPEDEVTSINGVKLQDDPKGTVKELLNETVPGTRIEIEVLRGGEHLNLELVTDSQATRNARLILNHLQENHVVRGQLKKMGAESMIDRLEATMISDVRSASSPRRAIAMINSRLAELKVSHLAVIPKVLNPLQNDTSDSGIEIHRHIENGKYRYFVAHLPSQVSQSCDLLLGDEVVRINQVPVSESSRLWGLGSGFVIQTETGSEVTLDVRSEPDLVTRKVRFQVKGEHSPVTRTEESVRVYEQGDFRIGYIHLVDFMSFEVPKILKAAIAEQFVDCDGIVVDLRGHGGLVPVGMQVEKSLEKFGRPVFSIIDGKTSSAKEICAYRLKKLSNVQLVGTKTAGSVLGAAFHVLPSGDAFIYPGVSGNMLGGFVDNVDLEGLGVEPDQEIQEKLPYAKGKSLLLEKSLFRFEKFLQDRSDNQGATQPDVEDLER